MKIRILTILLLLSCLLINSAFAKNSEPPPKQAKQKPPTEKPAQKKPELDWGDWEQKFKPQQRYGVGIKGKLQSAISELDKSNLLNDSNGVQVTPADKSQKPTKTLDIKKMKAELKALEKKVEQEIDDDIDY